MVNLLKLLVFSKMRKMHTNIMQYFFKESFEVEIILKYKRKVEICQK